jgi:hypothetical protein
VRLQGKASSPTPDTQVRTTAWALEVTVRMKIAIARTFKVERTLVMMILLLEWKFWCEAGSFG